MNAEIIEHAAHAGFTTYFGNRKPWPEPPTWTPEKQTWLEFAARILIGEITDARQAHAWFIDIRVGKEWNDLGWNRKAIWVALFRAIEDAGAAYERKAAA